MPPANQLQVFENHIVRLTTAMVPLSHTGFLYHFPHCSGLLFVKKQIKGGGFTLSCSLGKGTVHHCWGSLASAAWGGDPVYYWSQEARITDKWSQVPSDPLPSSKDGGTRLLKVPPPSKTGSPVGSKCSHRQADGGQSTFKPQRYWIPNKFQNQWQCCAQWMSSFWQSDFSSSKCRLQRKHTRVSTKLWQYFCNSSVSLDYFKVKN